MNCAACGHANREGAAFCEACGQRLERERVPRAYAPEHLVQKIRTGQRRLAGERKQVTVLFADVTGSMALAESVDPEAWQRIMDRFFVLLCDGVHRFEGTVNKFTGDGIMALFGAPIAHEDHARRACYAALHLRDELARYAAELRREHGLSFSVRMGLNSGEVVVGTIGDDLELDYTAIGHTVGLAQRMESLAEPGHAYLTEHTARLVDGFFALQDLGAFELKGVSGPVRVFRLEGTGALRTRLDVAGARGFSRFVGRRDELAALEGALAAALEGNGAVVGVMGEPGVGKSRLCHELVERCRAREIAVFEGHGVSHAKRIPLLPILELTRGSIGVTEHDSEQAAREKIAGRLLLLDDAFREDLPLVFDFLGVPDPERPPARMDPEARERRLFAIAQRLIHARARREPAVYLLEDLHWFDEVSEAYLENVIEAVPGTQTLVLATFRPGYHARWMDNSYSRQIALAPLGDAAADELLRDLLGVDPSLDGLAERIRARTGGNPFFIEEVVQALAESEALEGQRGIYRLRGEIDEIAIPATVRAVLEARIDRLGAAEKAVLQGASVIGREFSQRVLRRVVDGEEGLSEVLAALVDAELIYEHALYPEVEYAFKHPLTQEVAYASQLSERRARLHAAVARTLAELAGGEDGERAALLAHHWERAREPVHAAAAHRRAAEWAGVLHPQEAIRHWHRVRELLAGQPDTPQTAELQLAACTQVLNLGWRVGLSEEEISAALDDGRALAQRTGDLVAHARLLATAAAARGVAGDIRGALAQTLEAAQLAEQTGNPALEAVAFLGAFLRYLLGDLRAALADLDHTIEVTRGDPRLGMEIWGYSPHASARMLRAQVLPLLGRVQEAKDERERALALARELGDDETLGWARGVYTYYAMVTGDTEGVLDQAYRGWEVAERLGSPFSQMYALSTLARAHNLRAEWEQAAVACERGLALARTRRSGIFEGLLLSQLADAQLGLGNVEAARSTAKDTIAVARRRGTRFSELTAQLTLARAWLAAGGARAAEGVAAALDRARALTDETGAVSMEPFICIARAELAHVRGDEAARTRELSQARRLFEAIGAPERAAQLAAHGVMP
jgi:class 3 adenylate cyclase/tetratricopeptide (TPR) repeat protein